MENYMRHRICWEFTVRQCERSVTWREVQVRARNIDAYGCWALPVSRIWTNGRSSISGVKAMWITSAEV